MNSLFRLVVRNFRASLHRGMLVFTFIFPLFFVYVMGFAFAGIVPPFDAGGKNLPYTVFLAAGAAIFTVINTGFSVAGTLFWMDRKLGMFEQLLVGPFTRAQYIAGILVSSVLTVFVSATLVLVLSTPVLLQSEFRITPIGVVYMVFALLVGSIFFGALNIAISTKVRSHEAFNLISPFLFLVFLFPSSFFYPAERAPVELQIILFLNPLTYTTDIFRAGLLSLSSAILPFEALALVAESIGMFALALFLFRKIRL
ncbi:MAG: ABC transporter permease [Candidatus Bathyarchaeia archaeon]